MVAVSSWGRLSADDHDVRFLTHERSISRQLHGDAKAIAYGMGRSYGDECLNPGGRLWNTSGLDHLIAFDDVSGRLQCEAGVLLRDIQQVLVPRGWMLPVTPGTQLLTVGGAIANDVHGKNHHVAGSFGDHVVGLTLARTDGRLIQCGPDEEADWFSATVGGMGLTGVITRAEIRLMRVAGPWIATETLPFDDLEQFLVLADESEADWRYTVAWVDCSSGAKGRGIFMRGNPSTESTRELPRFRKLRIPVVPPVSLVNKLSLRPFNTAYYYAQRSKAGPGIAHYESFFYPLDNVLDWNRMYGPRGFYQYQSVVPRAEGLTAVRAMLEAISATGQGSFLGVLKTFGSRAPLGMMSFPQPGVTLALDFPNRGASTGALFERLDAIVRRSCGRIYPAKDARMPKDLFETGYPRLEQFRDYRDPGLSSAMSRRLMGS